MSLMRGIGSDLPLMDWLSKVIWKIEGELVSPEFVRAGALLGVLEMIRSGTTLFLDMYFFEEEVGAVVEEAGIRAGLGFGILDFPTKVAKTPDEYLQRARSFVRDLKGKEKIFPVLCPHAVYTCSPPTLRKAFELALEEDLFIHIHLSETKDEVQRVKEEYGSSPVMHLENLGLLNDKVIAAHMVWVSEEETDLIKDRGVKVVHCPESNLKLGSGVAPVPRYIQKGVHLCLGTDGSASNDNLDMLEEMSTMAKLHKGTTLNPRAITAAQALSIATEMGFSAVGIKGGRIEEGYVADLILINTDSPHLSPLYDPISQIVYSAKSSDIDTVICGGKIIMEGGEVKTLDQEKILKEAERWAERIRGLL
jgi:5-methylthioadenosine/S-adenosylhomocysteine deaminase